MKRSLEGMKLHPGAAFNDVLERILDDVRELDKKTLEEVGQAQPGIKVGKYLTQGQVLRALGL